jgi:hypothetical protein
MTDDAITTGPVFTVSITGRPAVRYAKGSMLVVRGSTRTDLVEALGDVLDDEQLATAYLDTFKTEAEATIKAVAEGILVADSAEEVTPEEPKKKWTPKPKAASSQKVSSFGGVSDKQEKAIFAISRAVGMEDDDVLSFAAEAVGRDVNAVGSLTRKEASALIDALKEVQDTSADA